MIQSLLGRSELRGPWTRILANVRGTGELSWSAEDARAFLDDLEIGDFHRIDEIKFLLRRIVIRVRYRKFEYCKSTHFWLPTIKVPVMFRSDPTCAPYVPCI
jgi:hypothetical protein